VFRSVQKKAKKNHPHENEGAANFHLLADGMQLDRPLAESVRFENRNTRQIVAPLRRKKERKKQHRRRKSRPVRHNRAIGRFFNRRFVKTARNGRVSFVVYSVTIETTNQLVYAVIRRKSDL